MQLRAPDRQQVAPQHDAQWAPQKATAGETVVVFDPRRNVIFRASLDELETQIPMTATIDHDASTLPLIRGARRLHIPACQHVIRHGGLPATAEEQATMDICEWCASEISGLGRTYYDNLEDAMRAFGTYASTKELIRSAVKNVDYDSIWIPYSNSYIALGRKGLGVGWILRTIMQLNGRAIELPDYSPRSRSNSGDTDSRGQVCTGCFIEMPLSGVCDNCD